MGVILKSATELWNEKLRRDLLDKIAYQSYGKGCGYFLKRCNDENLEFTDEEVEIIKNKVINLIMATTLGKESYAGE